MPEGIMLPFRRAVSYNAEGGYYDDLIGRADSYYESNYLDLNPTMHEEDVPSKVEAFRRALEGPLADVVPESLLDVGCGSCKVLQECLSGLNGRDSREVKGFGVDISGRILEAGVSDARITRIRANCCDLPLASNRVNIAMCFDILEHVSASEAVVAEVARVAEYGVFKVPLEIAAYTWIRGGARRLAELRAKFGHVRHFSKRSLLSLIASSWQVMDLSYMKIPRRGLLADRSQEALLAMGLYGSFAALFGGFAVVVGRSLSRN